MAKKECKNFIDGGLIVDHELYEFIPSMTDAELNQFKANAVKDNCISGYVVVWRKFNIIIDGHHIYKTAEQLGLPYEVVEKDFKDIEAVKFWMLDNLLGKKQLSKNQLVAISIPLLFHPYREICRGCQSAGGTKSSRACWKKLNPGITMPKKSKKGLETCDLIKAKLGMNIGIGLIKNGISIFKNNKELLPLIKNGVLVGESEKPFEVKDAKYLQKKKSAEAIENLVDESGNLTKEAITFIDAFRSHKLTKEEKDFKDAKKEAAEAKIKNEIKDFCDNLPQEYEEKQIFSGDFSFINALKDPSKFIAIYKVSSREFPVNVVVAIHNSAIHLASIQKITSFCALYCESKEYPIRLLYFGSEKDNFNNFHKKLGGIGMYFGAKPEIKTRSRFIVQG